MRRHGRLPDFDDLDSGIRSHRPDAVGGVADLAMDLIHGGVAATQPDDPGRRPPQLVPVCIIRVLSDNDPIMGLRVFPNGKIIGLRHADQSDVEGSREEIL